MPIGSSVNNRIARLRARNEYYKYIMAILDAETQTQRTDTAAETLITEASGGQAGGLLSSISSRISVVGSGARDIVARTTTTIASGALAMATVTKDAVTSAIREIRSNDFSASIDSAESSVENPTVHTQTIDSFLITTPETSQETIIKHLRDLKIHEDLKEMYLNEDQINLVDKLFGMGTVTEEKVNDKISELQELMSSESDQDKITMLSEFAQIAEMVEDYRSRTQMVSSPIISELLELEENFVPLSPRVPLAETIAEIPTISTPETSPVASAVDTAETAPEPTAGTTLLSTLTTGLRSAASRAADAASAAASRAADAVRSAASKTGAAATAAASSVVDSTSQLSSIFSSTAQTANSTFENLTTPKPDATMDGTNQSGEFNPDEDLSHFRGSIVHKETPHKAIVTGSLKNSGTSTGTDRPTSQWRQNPASITLIKVRPTRDESIVPKAGKTGVNKEKTAIDGAVSFVSGGSVSGASYVGLHFAANALQFTDAAKLAFETTPSIVIGVAVLAAMFKYLSNHQQELKQKATLGS